MRETRRRFVLALAAAALCMQRATLLSAQRRRPFPDPPEPAEKQNPAAMPQTSTQRSTRKALQDNEREFRAGVDHLYQLAGELRDEVQKTATSDVLSIRMYKKTEEIEKLAKQLKSKAKG
jgi:hypothetical protein